MTCLLAAVWLAPGPAWSAVAEFDNVMDAHRHCPYDTVVSIDGKSTGYRNQNTRQRIKPGYVCRDEAVNGGYGGLVTRLKPVPQPRR